MTHQRRLAVITLGAAVAIAAACSKPAPPPPPAPVAAPTPPPIDSTQIKRQIADSVARAEAMRRQHVTDDSIARARAAADAAAAAAGAAARDAEGMRATIAAPIHFDFDKSELRDDTKALLDSKLPILTANSGLTIRIAGHTDERGSGEYNLQLGQRRAASARDYLTARGVNTARIELVSYGEERPVCTEHNEACWQQNRRYDFRIVTIGSDRIVIPPQE